LALGSYLKALVYMPSAQGFTQDPGTEKLLVSRVLIAEGQTIT